MASILSELFLAALRAVVVAYDIFTWPVYRALETPWREKTKQKLGPVVRTRNDSQMVAFKREKGNSDIYQEIIVKNKVKINLSVNQTLLRACFSRLIP